MNSEDIVVFLDNIQRTVVATVVNDGAERFVVKCPVLLTVTPQQDKRLQIQLYPLFFREFTVARDKFVHWTYDRRSIVISDATLEPNLIAQYKQMFQTAPQQQDTPVIKLFDEDDK